MKYASKIISVAFSVAVGLLFWGASPAAFAECNFASGQGPQTVGIPVGNVVVQRDAPVGSMIYSSKTAQGATFIECDTDINTNYYKMNYLGAIPTSIAHTYATNVPGVGIKVFVGWGYLDNPPSTDNTGIGSVNLPPVQLQLYKTGDIQPGQLTSGEVGTWTVSDITPMTVNLVGGTITQVACSLVTPKLTFPIGDVLLSEFGSAAGYIPERASTQNLGLECDKSANINVTLNGTPSPDVSDGSVLALNNQQSAGTAQGVGVQLLYGGNPITINNRITLGQSSGGRELFPITARYYQTRNKVTVGEANASATLTLTYQ